MGEFDGTVVWKTIAIWFYRHRVWIRHPSPGKKCEPFVELADGGEWACFMQVVDAEGSIVDGFLCDVAYDENGQYPTG